MLPKRGWRNCRWLFPATIYFMANNRKQAVHQARWTIICPVYLMWHREVESSLFVNFTHALGPCDRLCMSPKANSMKDRDRNPALSLSYPLAGKHEFCVSRVLVGCALTTIESFDN